MVNIFEFSDSRLFIKRCYEARKAANPSFSYRTFSSLMRANSPNFIKLIIDGKRNLTVPNIYRLSTALGLNLPETKYLFALVHYTQETDPEVREFFRAEMNEVSRPESFRTINKATFPLENEAWSKPSTFPVLSLANGRRKDEIVALVVTRSKISREEVEGALEAAVKDGVLILEDEIYKHPTYASNIIHKGVDPTIYPLLKAGISDSLAALDKYLYKQCAVFFTTAFTVRDLNELGKKARKIKDRVFSEIITDCADSRLEETVAAQLMIQIFPVIYDEKDVFSGEARPAKSV